MKTNIATVAEANKRDEAQLKALGARLTGQTGRYIAPHCQPISIAREAREGGNQYAGSIRLSPSQED